MQTKQNTTGPYWTADSVGSKGLQESRYWNENDQGSIETGKENGRS